jgi:hypothetical protein
MICIQSPPTVPVLSPPHRGPGIVARAGLGYDSHHPCAAAGPPGAVEITVLCAPGDVLRRPSAFAENLLRIGSAFSEPGHPRGAGEVSYRRKPGPYAVDMT